MTRTDILAKVQRNELTLDEANVLLEKLDKLSSPTHKPPQFKVAEKSGWCSVYFDGLWRPCTLPSQVWLELLEADNVERFKKFLVENKGKFRSSKV